MLRVSFGVRATGEKSEAALPYRQAGTGWGILQHFRKMRSIAEVMNAIYNIVGEEGGQFDHLLFFIFRKVPQRFIFADSLPLAKPFSNSVFVGP